MQISQGGAIMYLNIDGKQLQPQPGQSLLDLVREAGMDSEALSKRPLAAKLAGEVFTLNYIPLRHKDVRSDTPSMRRAMAASIIVPRPCFSPLTNSPTYELPSASVSVP